jgi:hypothetical protein
MTRKTYILLEGVFSTEKEKNPSAPFKQSGVKSCKKRHLPHQSGGKKESEKMPDKMPPTEDNVDDVKETKKEKDVYDADGVPEIKGEKTSAETVEPKRKKGRPAKVSNQLNDEIMADSMFWYYVSLGEKRSLEKVSEHFDTDLWVLKEMSRRYDWQKKLQEVISTDNPMGQDIVQFADTIRLAVLQQIINNPDTKPADKLKALDQLTEFISRSNELIRKKRIVIEFNNRDQLQKIVDGLLDGTIYRNIGSENSFASPLPDNSTAVNKA